MGVDLSEYVRDSRLVIFLQSTLEARGCVQPLLDVRLFGVIVSHTGEELRVRGKEVRLGLIGGDGGGVGSVEEGEQ